MSLLEVESVGVHPGLGAVDFTFAGVLPSKPQPDTGHDVTNVAHAQQ